ncbi:MAG: hypothetical protein KBS81_03600 [Spirochaetales bacterium]|nr:hypothetical protein [Candidatus Physcosoma equi]
MFVRDRNDSWLQKVKVEVGTLLGLGTDEEAYITLKEIPTIQMLELKDSYEKGDKALMEFFRGILPSIIVDHNFYETETKKMESEAIAELVFGSLALTRKVMDTYTQAAFFTRRKVSEDR